MRDYKSEYKNYQGKPEQIKNRASRNLARRLMKKKM
jgi:flagellar biosynthesis protein FlhB